ncbi:hypothetical protein HZS_4309 [Henneguya salminicola]|nr:hypothetical protein HZS_4309 [Henneguya salminicola]
MEYAWIPRIITVNFEYSLISTIKHEFTEIWNAQIIYCPSNFEILTILEISEVIDGINYIKPLLIRDESFETFWNYFAKIWLKRFPLSLWNINSYGVYYLAGRTKKCLERYYRRIGDFFLNTHINLAAFISVIKTEFDFYSDNNK